MGFESVRSSRIPRLAAEQASNALFAIRRSTRDLLLDHAKDHPRRNRGKLECPMCDAAAKDLHLVDEVLAGDYFA